MSPHHSAAANAPPPDATHAGPPRPSGLVLLLGGMAVLALGLHLAAGSRYGIFRDELYFIACGERLAWGYVDQPPLIAWVARLAHGLFGDQVLGLRLLPSFASAGTVVLTGLLARRLGADGVGVALATTAVLAAPVLLALGHYLTMNAFEPLLWVAVAYAVVRRVEGADGRGWLAVGLLVGLGLLTKYSMGFLVVGLVAGLLLTPERRVLRDRWLAGAVLLAFLLVLPNVLWQWEHDLPMLEVLRNGRLYKNTPFDPGGFLVAQLVEVNPLNALVWMGGLVWLLVSPAARRYRFLGWAFVGVLAIELFGEAKPYYLAPAFPMLFAAGGAAWSRWVPSRRGRLAALAAVGATGLLLAPLAIPLLSPEGFLAWQEQLGVAPEPLEQKRLGPLPQIFADQFGWEDWVGSVADVFQALPEAERSRAGIFVGNYGEASALELYGAPLGLPRPMSGHNSYFLWGPTPGRVDPIVVVSRDEAAVREAFHDVRRAGTTPVNPWAMPYENGIPIWVGRDLKGPMDAIWPGTKHFE